LVDAKSVNNDLLNLDQIDPSILEKNEREIEKINENGNYKFI